MMLDSSSSTSIDTLAETLSVTSISWRKYYKSLHLESGNEYLDVPLSACVGTGDRIAWSDDTVNVICQHGTATILPTYAIRETIRMGTLEIGLVIKEITEAEEYEAYKSLANFHYRGKSLFGRTAKLIVRAFHPFFPKVLGYIELATPLYMNKARSHLLNAPFKQNGISWQVWDMNMTRKYVNLVVRVARCVVYPEFRGLGIGQLLMRRAADFAADRWQIGGLKPIFLEISADMLKFVPFAERAGLTFIGETEGNLKRVYEDMEYLTRSAERVRRGEIVRQDSSGIVDQQVARMERAFKLAKQEGMALEDLLQRLQNLSRDNVLRDFALFHEIVSLPKPTYMRGLTAEAEDFVHQRAATIAPINEHGLSEPIAVERLDTPILLDRFCVTFHSQVRRTQQSHAVQQAFGISPDKIDTPVIQDLTLQIDPGQIVLIIGPSGSGKTSLLNCFANIGMDSLGDSVELKGIFELPDNYRPGKFEPIRSKKALIEILADKSIDQALHIMGLVGLSDAYVYLKRFDELSKGQQFRAMLARLIAVNANLWLVDEFCANLDLATSNVVADKLQRTARKYGATVIVAAPHCQYFLHSLKPDIVIQLTTAWEHSIIPGKDFMQRVKKPTVGVAQPQTLRIRSEYLHAIRQGKKYSTIRKGKQPIERGFLLLECGTDRQIVNVTDVEWCQVRTLTIEHAFADGFEDIAKLRKALTTLYPDLRLNHYVTVVKFDTLICAPKS